MTFGTSVSGLTTSPTAIARGTLLVVDWTQKGVYSAYTQLEELILAQ